MATLRIKSIDGDTDFQDVKLYINPTLKENLLIFNRDGKATFDYNKVKKATEKWTILVVNNLSEAVKQISEKFKYKERMVSHMLIKSHGMTFNGADLDTGEGVGVVHKFSEDKNSPEVFLKKLLKNDAEIVFTACSIIQSFDKVFENKNLTPEKNKANHLKAKETVTNYFNFWIKGTSRNLFIDYTSTSSWNYSNDDKSRVPNDHGNYFSDGDSYWFLFDKDFIIPKKKYDQKTKKQIKSYFAGFVWFVDKNGTWANKPDFYQMQVKSLGGIVVTPIKNIKENKMLPEDEQIKKKF